MKKIEKKTNPRTIDEHFDQKSGEPGTSSRDAFEEKSQAFMITDVVKDA